MFNNERGSIQRSRPCPQRHRPLWPSSLHAKLHAKLRTASQLLGLLILSKNPTLTLTLRFWVLQI